MPTGTLALSPPPAPFGTSIWFVQPPTRMPSRPPEAVERVAQLARRRGILFQRGITAGGNDGSVFLPHGAVSVPLTWPLRYAHSAVEVADLADAEALQNVVRLLLESELLGE